MRRAHDLSMVGTLSLCPPYGVCARGAVQSALAGPFKPVAQGADHAMGRLDLLH
ncbi:hypothetical protein AB7M17_001388 [Bradyrhizobium sp. USDA 377]